MSNLHTVNALSDSAWHSFLAENPHSSIFHTPEMFQVFAKAKGYEPQLWAAVDQSGAPLALLLPVRISLMSGFMRTLTSRSVAFGSVLWQPGTEGLIALAKLLADYTGRKNDAPLYTELRNLRDLGDGLPVLEKTKFTYEEHLNYLIDLGDGPEVVFQQIGARTRKNIRHGLNRGDVEIEEIKDKNRIVDSYKLLQKTYENAQVPLPDISLFEAAYDVLFPKGMIRFAQARVEGRDVSTSVELLYKDVMYGWYGGVDREFGKYAPNEMVMWNVLEWGSKNGYRVYDFGGAGKPDEKYGVRDFKAKFGGQLVSYGRNIHVHRPAFLWFSKVGYQMIRRWL